MITVNIGNSYSNIKGLSGPQEKDLAKLLSFTVGGKSAYFSGGYVRTRSLLGKRGDFPSGLLNRVTRYLKTLNLTECRFVNNRSEPKPQFNPVFKGPQPYEDQLLALEAAEHYKQGTIVLPTGCGKTLLCALIAARLGIKTLIVVPTLEIKKQFKEALNEYLIDSSFIDVHNIDSKELKKQGNYGCLIIDEAHHTASKTYQKLNKTVWTNIYYRYFLTATPFRNDSEETLLFESIAGRVIYRLTYKTAIAKGYIVPVEAYYIDVPKQAVKGYTYAEVYKELVVNNEVRNKLISDLLVNLYESKSSTLCLVKEVLHGNNIADMTGAAFTCGEDNESKVFIDSFNKRKLNTLIGTTGVLGEGIDTKPAEYVVIAGLGKAKSQFQQQVGRGVRLYPGKESCKVIIFKDKSHKWTLKHFNEQKKILLEEYGVIPVKLNI